MIVKAKTEKTSKEIISSYWKNLDNTKYCNKIWRINFLQLQKIA